MHSGGNCMHIALCKMRSAMQSSNAMQPWTPQPVKGPSRGLYAFFRTLCVAQVGPFFVFHASSWQSK
jgi:hypothetical protein